MRRICVRDLAIVEDGLQALLTGYVERKCATEIESIECLPFRNCDGGRWIEKESFSDAFLAKQGMDCLMR
jgi:hypothetical protein